MTRKYDTGIVMGISISSSSNGGAGRGGTTTAEKEWKDYSTIRVGRSVESSAL